MLRVYIAVRATHLSADYVCIFVIPTIVAYRTPFSGISFALAVHA